MAIFRSPANEKDEISNGLATGAFVPPPPSIARARSSFPFLAPATQATTFSVI